jgi:hypothetical protein
VELKLYAMADGLGMGDIKPMLAQGLEFQKMTSIPGRNAWKRNNAYYLGSVISVFPKADPSPDCLRHELKDSSVVREVD